MDGNRNRTVRFGLVNLLEADHSRLLYAGIEMTPETIASGELLEHLDSRLFPKIE